MTGATPLHHSPQRRGKSSFAQVAFDVGGTFTDFVLQDAEGRLHTGKRLTTYPDPTGACLEGLDEIMARTGALWPELARAVHGSTLGSRWGVQGNGANGGL